MQQGISLVCDPRVVATYAETASFFRLALRGRLATTADVERWIDVVLEAEPVIEHPIADLAGASRLDRGNVDELLKQLQGPVRELLPGRMVMALIARRLRLGEVTAAHAVGVADQRVRWQLKLIFAP